MFIRLKFEKICPVKCLYRGEIRPVIGKYDKNRMVIGGGKSFSVGTGGTKKRRKPLQLKESCAIVYTTHHFYWVEDGHLSKIAKGAPFACSVKTEHDMLCLHRCHRKLGHRRREVKRFGGRAPVPSGLLIRHKTSHRPAQQARRVLFIYKPIKI